MSTPVVAFFNNKGGVGKTSLVYHLAHMCADMNRRSLMVDLDPQANLTTAFLDDDRLEELWPDGPHRQTMFGCIEPLLRGVGDIEREPYTEPVESNLGLLAGDLALARFEDELSAQWPLCRDGKERAFRVVSALWRLMQSAALRTRAEFILVDLGPNLGAINRAALVGADFLVVPLTPAAPSAPRQMDRHCIGLVKSYRSLMWMAEEARKPMFHLRPADGAIGSHASVTQEARENFRAIAEAIMDRCGLRPSASVPGKR